MHVLSPQQTAQLLGLLFEGDDKPLATTSKVFQEAFGGPLLFSACCSIILLLEDAVVLKPAQRLLAWFLLATCWTHHSAALNPFAAYLIKVACNEASRPHERNLLLEVLYHQQQQQDGGVGDKDSRASETAELAAGLASPVEYFETCQLTFVRAAGPAELAAVEQQLTGTLGLRAPSAIPATCFASAALPPFISDDTLLSCSNSWASETSISAADEAASRRTVASALLTAAGPVASASSTTPCNHLLPCGFEPAWVRPAPAVMAPTSDEYKWLEMDLHGDLVWDSSMCEDTSRLCSVRDLVGRALRGPLLPAQQQQVLSELDAEPHLVHRTGLTPRRLPALVEHCPVLAFELLLRLIKAPTIAEYLSVLAGTEMSLHSMEVVNRLTTSVSLPTEFIHLYIANCISSCEVTQDKYVQNRLVRLVCVFLQSLIRNKIINIADLLHEVQAFCINFSRIREAAKLFRLLKQIEAGGSVRPGDSSPSQSHAGDLFAMHSFADDTADDILASGSHLSAG